MDRKFHLLAALSLLALGASSNSEPAMAREFAGVDLNQCVANTGKTEEECACEAALESGKAMDLARFLEIYAKEAENTACAAVALVGPKTDTPPDNRYGG